MQEQVLSLQKSIGTVEENLVEVEGTIIDLNNTVTCISTRLDQLEQQPRTPPTEAQGTEAMPRPPKPYTCPRLLGRMCNPPSYHHSLAE